MLNMCLNGLHLRAGVLCAKFENSVQSLGAPAQREKRNADTLDLPLQNDCREKYTYFEDTNITQEW